MPNDIPRVPNLDDTLTLLSHGYEFIGKRCDELGSKIFRTRLMAQPVVCVTGRDAAEMFYGGGHFTRRGAMPSSTLRLLQDKGSVQLLDGDEHRHRKAMFMSMMTPQNITGICRLVRENWLNRLDDWQRLDHIVFFDEIRSILTIAACEWAGLPTANQPIHDIKNQIVAMLDNAGSFGPANWQATLERHNMEKWIAGIVEALRSEELILPTNCPANVVAFFKDRDGDLITVGEATAEIINLLRPIVAIGRYIVFIVHALETQKDGFNADLLNYDAGREAFAEEVRRFYPFFPMIGGRVSEDFEWQGHRFKEGQWVILDIYGSNHDRQTFIDPDGFDPTRFQSGREDNFSLIAQGGGDPNITHRCPGERMTIEVMKMATEILTQKMFYDLPDQDLTYSLGDLPTAPKSGIKMTNVRVHGEASGSPISMSV